MAGESAPLKRRIFAAAIPVGVAANSDVSVIGPVPFAGTVVGITYVPKATITGAATNNRSVAVVNKGQDGTGNTSVASYGFTNGNNAAAFDEKDLTLSGTPANLVVAKGDVLAFASNAVGTGITDPGGQVVVTLARA